MKALEQVYDDKLHNLDVDALIDVIENVQQYTQSLMEIRPQRSYRLIRKMTRMDEVIESIMNGTYEEEDYRQLLDDIAEIHRISKGMKRQMTQQFGKRPDFYDLDEVVLSGEEIDVKVVFNLMRGA